MKVRIAVAIVALALGATATAGANGSVASAGGKRPLLIANCFKPKFEPSAVVIACGDAGLIVENVGWSSWTRKAAEGTGTGVAKTCDPDCAAGGTVTAPIALALSKVRKCQNGKRIFTRLRYTWPSGSPVGGPASVAIPFGCKLLVL
jgi:hypothetical protein